MSTPTPTTSAKTHFDLLHEVKFTTRFDLPEKCPECGAKTSDGVTTYEPACGRIDWDENGEVCDTDVPEFFDEVVHEVHCRECRHVFSEGVTAMLTEVVETLDAQKMVAQLKAAPDLLDFAALLARLETDDETLERTGDNQSGDDAVEALSGLIHKARALVAKAEGGE